MTESIYKHFGQRLRSRATRVIKYIFQPLAFRLKRYFLSDIYMQTVSLHERLKKLDEDLKQPDEALSLLPGIFDHVLSLNEKVKQLHEIKKEASVVTAGDLYLLFSEISQRKNLWTNADVILTCPATFSGAKLLFPEKRVIRVRHNDELLDAFEGCPANTLGVVSPWLFQEIIDSGSKLHLLLRFCRSKLIFVCSPPKSASLNIQLRKSLHLVGFYEIARILDDNRVDEASIGCLADGSFRLFGNSPGYSDGTDEWDTYFASRAPKNDMSALAWRSAGLNPTLQEGENGYSVGAAECNLFITNAPPDPNYVDELSISANIQWTGAGLGSASLVGCYQGLFQSKMYACSLENPSGDPIVSLWVVSDNKVTRLASCTLDSYHKDSKQSVQSTNITLLIRDSLVTVKVGDHEVLNIINSELPRVYCMGIKLDGSAFSVSDIVTPSGELRGP